MKKAAVQYILKAWRSLSSNPSFQIKIQTFPNVFKLLAI